MNKKNKKDTLDNKHHKTLDKKDSHANVDVVKLQAVDVAIAQIEKQ